MKKYVGATLLIAALAMAGTARAELLEFRVGAGISGTDQSDFEDKVNQVSGGGISANELESYNADLLVNIPAFPIGVGVRYEVANQKDSSNGTDFKLDVSNLSLFADWRIINTVVYIGPIVSVGYPWADLDFSSGGSSASQSLNNDQLTYSGGLEGGVAFGKFVAGAEAGYKSMKFKSDDTSSGIQSKVDLSGFYGKLMVGIRFL